LTRAEPWYRASFGEDYLEVYAHRDDRQGSEQARAVVRLLGLAPGARVLDVACGAGRHAFALREIGIEVIGVDLSPALLRAAVRRARDAGASSGGFVRGDMRHLPFRASNESRPNPRRSGSRPPWSMNRWRRLHCHCPP